MIDTLSCKLQRSVVCWFPAGSKMSNLRIRLAQDLAGLQNYTTVLAGRSSVWGCGRCFDRRSLQNLSTLFDFYS